MAIVYRIIYDSLGEAHEDVYFTHGKVSVVDDRRHVCDSGDGVWLRRIHVNATASGPVPSTVWLRDSIKDGNSFPGIILPLAEIIESSDFLAKEKHVLA